MVDVDYLGYPLWIRDPGKILYPPLPLSVSKVLEGWPVDPDTLIFRLPSEILSQIVQDIDKKDLASLALVNSACRQLVRSRQFASVTMNYSEESCEILAQLMRESKGFLNNECPRWHLSTREILSEDDPSRALGNENDRIGFEEFTLNILSLIRGPSRLPHLETVEWRNSHDIPIADDYFIDTVTSSSNLRNIVLCNLRTSKQLSHARQSPSTPSQQLQCLFIQNCTFDNEDKADQIRVRDLIRGSSKSLETLFWDLEVYYNKSHVQNVQYSLVDDDSPAPVFENLRNLSLKAAFSDVQTWKCLLAPQLRILDIRAYAADDLSDQCLQELGHKRNLHTFSWARSAAKKTSVPLAFLKANTQISRLGLAVEGRGGSKPEHALEHDVLPLLIHAFQSLTSLQIFWDGWHLPAANLEMISQISTLEEIHLGTCSTNWSLDHDVILNSLGNLAKLKRIGFSHDEHRMPVFRLLNGDLYFNDDETPLDPGVNPNRVAHDRLEDIANSYLAVFQRLEWLAFDNVSFLTSGSVDDGSRRMATANSEIYRHFLDGVFY
ncbi:F-box [Glarea lozoyensis ATCC 20868]|uniref:F-box n=1 Tax=Glarea lozoyensis (strain ATCC 20868 / MF5171) TaxID=1116229 RepID=S3D8K8_GLAL2|nr:F-box [Glarea lozoyensis ATCC 20868]EPE28331.1 F-box [Glarea lozoyensis ATCC 20868]